MRMPRPLSGLGLAVCLLLELVPAAGARTSAPAGRGPARRFDVDVSQRVGVGEVSMALSNVGTFGFDYGAGQAGVEFPRGSGKTVIYSAGLWVSGKLGTSSRVALSGYTEEFMAGAAPGGVDDDPANPDYRVYRLHRTYATPAERDAALAAYNAGAVPHGAPVVAVNADGSLALGGEEMAWSVYNDLDPSNHQNPAGRSAPLRLEVQQTTFTFDRDEAFRHTVLQRFRIINRAPLPLTDVIVGFWSDPDLGGASDDLTGSDPALGLGYCYNATNADAVYGSAPPAVGFDILRGPLDSLTLQPAPTRSFSRFLLGADPDTVVETLNVMRGLQPGGGIIWDPALLDTTAFMLEGDPITGSGWVDGAAQDQRMLITTGPVTMQPDEAKDIWVALIVAQGTDRLDSVAKLKAYDQHVQALFDAQTLPVLAVPEAAAPALAIERAFPNPSRGTLSLSFSLAAAGDARLEVLDVSGRAVIERSLSGLAAGRHTLRVAEGGERLAPGLYFVRLQQAGRIAASRVAVVR